MTKTTSRFSQHHHLRCRVTSDSSFFGNAKSQSLHRREHRGSCGDVVKWSTGSVSAGHYWRYATVGAGVVRHLSKGSTDSVVVCQAGFHDTKVLKGLKQCK